MDALKAAGAVGFTDDGIPLMNEKLVYEAMKKAKELNVPLSFHEEDPAFISENGINAGAVAKELGITGSPALALIPFSEMNAGSSSWKLSGTFNSFAFFMAS